MPKVPEPKSQVHEAIRNRINRSKLVLHEETSSINKERFFHYFNKAEASDENKEQCFFTIDKGYSREKISHFIFAPLHTFTIPPFIDGGWLRTPKTRDDETTSTDSLFGEDKEDM